MKFCLSLCVLLAFIYGLSAASLRAGSSMKALTLEKGVPVGDIWTDCSKSGDGVKINSVTLSPDPPQKGKSLSAKVSVTTSVNVTGGNVHIELKWGIIKVVDENMKVCDALKDASLACPLKPGTYDVSQSVPIPGSAPSGHYKGNVEATGADGKELLCINLDFHM